MVKVVVESALAAAAAVVGLPAAAATVGLVVKVVLESALAAAVTGGRGRSRPGASAPAARHRR